MLVKGQHLTTIWYEENNDAIRIIDQRLLPHELKILTLHSLAEVLFAIKEMLVRGAPLIGITAAYGMYIAARENSSIGFLRQSGENLKLTRPTAVNLSWAVDLILDKIINIEEINRPDYVLNLANQMRLADIQACKDIGENGFKLLETIYKKKNSTINILTHCNAGWLATVDWGTALSPIFKAKKKDIPIHVWVDETRPRNQGFNLTAWELLNENIPNTLIVDNVGGHLMQNGQVDVCITGTDRTSLNGDVCNKIGTYLKALSAFDNDIPFYVAAPISSFDFEMKDGLREMPIEERNADEISIMEGIDENNERKKIRIVPEGSVCKNYAFDVTPFKYITKLITEKGNIDANTDSIKALNI